MVNSEYVGNGMVWPGSHWNAETGERPRNSCFQFLGGPASLMLARLSFAHTKHLEIRSGKWFKLTIWYITLWLKKGW